MGWKGVIALAATVGGNDTFIAKDNKKDKVDGGPGPDRGKFDPQDTVSSVANRAFSGSC